MRLVNFKASGVKAMVWHDGEAWPKDGVNFSESEISWAYRLADDHADPDNKKMFWETLLEKKRARPTYSLFEDFPRSGNAEMAIKYCTAIKQRILHGRVG